MNWKQEAISKLNRYDAMVQAVYNLPREIKQLEENLASVRGVKPNQLSHVTPQRGDDFMINNLMKRQEMNLAYKNAKVWLNAMNRALNILTADDKKVLMDMYAYPMCGNLDRLCEELGVEKSSIYRKRDEALYRFTVALYGAAEQ